ncbi:MULTISPECIES: phosphoribosylglycinamide formyltransferase [unclassified Gemella]|uniref:phosphoribosylglycinamide formyltransferase n=1 Tax=unclassified Gemella TaxID=2624949 RepID=UPI001C059AD4|nr:MULTISPECIES: phosphoribosylglycinamide formyltransferase [unclassified Gemella]MBU0278987.1 phosphoribosylglycinamide formyltransferase [Gemella sp. zg-1178]QWQ38749.1 phosphoribosylglycinamide formyltransferase [Gemella sp. zg-570]
MVSRVAIFSSGNGSNFEAIVKEWQAGNIKNMAIDLLLSDKADAYVLKRAEKYNIEKAVLTQKNFSDKASYEKEILKLLIEKNIDFIVLAGYMRLIGETILNSYEGKIINIHPSILPAFKGKDAIQMALDYGVKYTGVSIHWVDRGMDTGKIIAQEVVAVEDNDNYESLAKKIHKIEHNLYPKVINELLNK